MAVPVVHLVVAIVQCKHKSHHDAVQQDVPSRNRQRTYKVCIGNYCPELEQLQCSTGTRTGRGNVKPAVVFTCAGVKLCLTCGDCNSAGARE